MNFSKEIITVLDYLCQKFGVAIDWTSDNVMPYIEDLCARYIQYEVFTSIAYIIIFPTIALIIAIPLAVVHKKAKNVNWEFNKYEFICTFAIVLWIVFALISIICIGVICVQTFDIIACHTLPEKVILEYLNVLMQPASN